MKQSVGNIAARGTVSVYSALFSIYTCDELKKGSDQYSALLQSIGTAGKPAQDLQTAVEAL